MAPLRNTRARRKHSLSSSNRNPVPPELNDSDTVLASASSGERHPLSKGAFSQDSGTIQHQREVNQTLACKPQHAAKVPASHSELETLPVEIVNHILSYLTLPTSRLPGLTEKESAHDYPRQEKNNRKAQEDLSVPPDTERFAADLFSWTKFRHPFNALAATSRCCQVLVESYCAHLVKACNRFNLPFDHVEKYGTKSVYPDMSSIVYRRLWLQVAPRPCVFCGAMLSSYPHLPTMRLLLTCEDCFFAQTLNFDEVQRQYHIADASILDANNVRRTPHFEWILRIDVEALALRLYRTREFHDKDPRLTKEHCEICHRAGTLQRDSKAEGPRRWGLLPSHVRSNSRHLRRGRS